MGIITNLERDDDEEELLLSLRKNVFNEREARSNEEDSEKQKRAFHSVKQLNGNAIIFIQKIQPVNLQVGYVVEDVECLSVLAINF